MSRIPVEPPSNIWCKEAITVFCTCSYFISSINPAVWQNFDNSDLYNGLGLLLHKPAYEIIDYIGNNYPNLTIENGLIQMKFFESPSFNWQSGSAYDFQTFADFTQHCSVNWSIEIQHFLEQIGYCNTTDAQNYANQWHSYAFNLYMDFLSMNPNDYKRLKWVARNGLLSNDEIENNLHILFAYSQGVVYEKNLIWIYFKMKERNKK